MNMSIDLSIIIVNYNTKELTLSSIFSVRKFTKNINYEIIVVDNGSTETLTESKDYKLIKSNENLGFAGGNNLGLKKAQGKYLLLLNSDTLIHNNVIGEMMDYLDKNSEIGIATCALKGKDGKLQSNGGYFPTISSVFSWMMIQDLPFIDNIIQPFHPKIAFYTKSRELDWVTGAFLLTRREVINQIGYLDDDYFMYVEDTDFCFRAKKKGWGIFYNADFSITHLGGASSAKEFPIISEFKNLKIFYKKHYPNQQYNILRIYLKLGSILRMILVSPKIYAKAFREI
ncbi:glycosyltransferase family 2 protein [soil metagenome]